LPQEDILDAREFGKDESGIFCKGRLHKHINNLVSEEKYGSTTKSGFGVLR
jgi:hypothetical protein